MTLITADTLDRDIELQFDGVRGYFTSGPDLVSDIHIWRHYRAAIRIINEMEARRGMVAEYDANLIADMGRPA